MYQQKYYIYSLFLIISFSLVGMQLTKTPSRLNKKFVRTAINQSDSLDAMRKAWRINHSPQEVVDISQGKIKIKEEISLGKRYGVCHNYAFTKLMGIVGKPKVLNIRGQRDYYAYADIADDGKEELSGLSILDFFDPVSGQSPQPGDLAVYIADGEEKNMFNRIMHTGIVVGDDCIESKWGPISAVFEHPIWYVPESFGNRIVYIRLNINVSDLLPKVQEKLKQAPIKKKYAESAQKNQQKLFDNIKEYERDKSKGGPKIYTLLEYDMNVHLDIPDENGITPLMHAKKIKCEYLEEFFAAYEAHKE